VVSPLERPVGGPRVARTDCRTAHETDAGADRSARSRPTGGGAHQRARGGAEQRADGSAADGALRRGLCGRRPRLVRGPLAAGRASCTTTGAGGGAYTTGGAYTPYGGG